MQQGVRGAMSRLGVNRGRSAAPLTLGLGVTAGAVLASALAAKVKARKSDGPEIYSDYDDGRPKRTLRPAPRKMSLILPPVLLAVALSGFSLWRARRSGRPLAPTHRLASLAGLVAQEFRRRSRERQTLH